MDKIKLDIPVIVEGKYDVIKLSSIIEGKIIKTDGFGLFNSPETARYIRSLAEKTKLIVLTDSDGAGLVIRNRISSILPKDRLIHLYIPQTEGKEKRKTSPSKEGYLGVEGIDADTLRRLLKPFESTEKKSDVRRVTKSDLFNDGLTGGCNSAAKRDALKKRLGLPSNLSANAMLDAINLLCTYEEYQAIIKESEAP